MRWKREDSAIDCRSDIFSVNTNSTTHSYDLSFDLPLAISRLAAMLISTVARLAYKDRSVCLILNFRSYGVYEKWFLRIYDKTREKFNAEERFIVAEKRVE